MKSQLLSFSLAALTSSKVSQAAFTKQHYCTSSIIRSFTKSSSSSSNSNIMRTKLNNNNDSLVVDNEYPGTAVQRLQNVLKRVASLSCEDDLSGDWDDVRRKILWAGGLKDLPNAIPGQVEF